jgi:hypothetical protein
MKSVSPDDTASLNDSYCSEHFLLLLLLLKQRRWPATETRRACRAALALALLGAQPGV